MRTNKLLILFAAMLTLACSQKADDGITDVGITFDASEGATTKAMLTDRTLKTNGNKIHVMDVLTNFTGTASWMDGDLYVNDDIIYNGSAVWGYDSGRDYPWTTDGTHQFFAWLSYDTTLGMSADEFFGRSVANGFSTNNRTLTIPSKEITAGSPQLDFMYAYTTNYIMPRGDTSPIPLLMRRLFSAISIQLRNESQDDILITSVSINGLKTTKSATISFLNEPTTSTLPQSGSYINNALFSALPVATRTLAYGETYDLLGRQKNAESAEFRLLWPQSAEDIAPSDVNDKETYPISVVYEYLSDMEHIQHQALLRFPEGATFQSGVRYAYSLLFTQKHVQLVLKVNPWKYELNEWSFTDQTISEVTELDFADNDGYDKPSKTCLVVGGQPVKGTFSIVNPSGAVWTIEPVGDVEYFTVSPTQGTINSEYPDYTFYVTPNLDPSLDRTTDKKLKFHFYVQFTDGSIHDANTEINRDDWTVILPKN